MNPFSIFFTVVYDYAFILQLASISFAAVFVLNPPEKKLKSIVFFAFKILGFFLVGTLLNCLLFALANVWPFLAGFNFSLSYLLVLVLFALIFSRDGKRSSLVLASTLYVSAMDIFALGSDLMSFVGVQDPGFVKALFTLFVLVMAYLMHRFSISRFDEVPLGPTLFVLVNAVVSMGMLSVMSYFQTHPFSTANYFEITVEVGLYLLSISAYFLTFFSASEHERVLTLQGEKKMLEADKELLSLSSQSLEELRKIRHDLKNQYAMMESFLANQQYDKLRSYFSELQHNFLPSVSYVDCGNEVLSAVLNIETGKAKASSIKLVSAIAVPKNLPFRDSDIGSLVSNMIDNAIESLERHPESNSAIEVKIALKGNGLYVYVSNPLSTPLTPEQLAKMNSEKGSGANHGLGHLIIQDIAERYHGYSNFSCENSLFIAEVFLETEVKGAVA